jgi:hypothetical protein
MDINTAIVSVTSASSTNVACPHVCPFGKHEATRPCPSVPGIPWMVFIYHLHQTFDFDQSFDAIRHRPISCTTRMLVLAGST